MCHGSGIVITSLFWTFIYSESCIKYSRAWLLSLNRTYLGSIHTPVSTGGGAVASCVACHYTHTHQKLFILWPDRERLRCFHFADKE